MSVQASFMNPGRQAVARLARALLTNCAVALLSCGLVLLALELVLRTYSWLLPPIPAAQVNAGLPPLLAMVVDQYPDYGGRGYKIAKLAEEAVQAAGADQIPTEDYYIRYNGRPMYVSKWEWHPDEVANYIWATMIAAKLRQRPDLQKFKR